MAPPLPKKRKQQKKIITDMGVHCHPNQTSETSFLKPSESNFPTAGQLKEISDHSYYRVFWHLKGHISHGVFWLACHGSW